MILENISEKLMKEYKFLVLQSGEKYLAEILNEAEDMVTVVKPMLIEHKYDTQGRPVFRYVPWQLLSSEDSTIIHKNHIVISTLPKTELLDIYQRICINFTPIEEDD